MLLAGIGRLDQHEGVLGGPGEVLDPAQPPRRIARLEVGIERAGSRRPSQCPP